MSDGPIRPQPGPQEMALRSEADITIYGGAAGGGKTFGLLLKPLQFIHLPTFSAAIFRRESPEITNPGSLWDESAKLYTRLGAAPNMQRLEWTFASGAKVKFSHMQREEDKENWKSAQVPLLGFDQLETFLETQFWYLMSRNRDPSGVVRSHIFGTCNPVPDDDAVGGWLRRLIAWWIDPQTGTAVTQRAGVVRWLVRDEHGVVTWYDTKAEAQQVQPGSLPKSLTFIPALLSDNPLLEKADPGYRASLMMLQLVDRERLLGGNWNARPTAGKVFDRAWFRTVRAAPVVARRVRYWDKAGTEDGGAYSAGVLIAEAGGVYYIEDVERGRWSSRKRNAVMLQVAEADARRGDVRVWVEQEPGSGGKESAEISIRELAGYGARAERVQGDKVARANPMSAQAEAGNVVLVEGEWNEEFLREAHGFPDGVFKDQVDAASGAFNKLALGAGRAPIIVPLDGQVERPRSVVAWDT